MNFGLGPKSPSFTEDPRGWNTAWELHLALVFGSEVEIQSATGPLATRPSITGKFPTEFYDQMVTDSTAVYINSLTSHICDLQHSLTVKAAQRIVDDDFQTRWMLCPPHEREEFILEGLVRTCKVSASYEPWRDVCPELTLKRLNHGSGEGFLDLLDMLCHPESQEPEKVLPDSYKTIPNAVFEKINSIGPNPHPGCVMLQKMVEGRRTYLLTMVAFHVLLAFYGERQEFGSVKPQRESPAEWKRLQKSLQNFLPPGVKVKDFKRSVDNYKGGERHCTSCMLPARLAGVDALLACQQCRAINRIVFYCSRECQITDWKSGKPPHKAICGKEGAIAAAFVSSTASQGP
ncbi:hypothetical protein DFH06DRAFT_1204874 [Mycena polygramma]|nr:hypothetical protein DFH06DRAFT_1204874 [Mycena polygramma]